jgi:Tol biopolymer transport system component
VDIIEESDGDAANTEGQRRPWWFVPGLAAVAIGALIGNLFGEPARPSAPLGSPVPAGPFGAVNPNACSTDACSYSPDGKMVAYAMPGRGLYVAPSAGGAARVLDDDRGEDLREAVAWSPDGSRIAYLDFVEDSPVYGHHAYGLSFVNPDGSGLRKLVVPLRTAEAGGLVWSPDGSRLAFWMPANGADWRPFSPWHGPVELFVVNANGSGLRQLTHEANCRGPLTPENYWMVVGRAGPVFTVDDCRGPVWSPDGSWIYFWLGEELSIVTTRPSTGTDRRN